MFLLVNFAPIEIELNSPSNKFREICLKRVVQFNPETKYTVDRSSLGDIAPPA